MFGSRYGWQSACFWKEYVCNCNDNVNYSERQLGVRSLVDSRVVVPVPKAIDVATGAFHSAVVTEAKVVYTFGSDFYPGDASGNSPLFPQQIRTDELFKRVIAGAGFCFAENDKNQMFSWGKNMFVEYLLTA